MKRFLNTLQADIDDAESLKIATKGSDVVFSVTSCIVSNFTFWCRIHNILTL